MTETQTPNPDCPTCGGTGFIPPFMDACTCAADGTELAAAKPAKPCVGDVITTLDDGGNTVWNGTEWVAITPTVKPHKSGDADFDELMDQANAWDAAPVHTGPTPPTDATEGDIWVAPMGDDPPFAAKTSIGRPATPAQEALLARLIAERDPSHPVVANAAILASASLLAREASKLIDALMAVPADPTRKKPRTNNYDGVCRHCGGPVPAETGVIHKVDGRWQTSHKPDECLTAQAKAEMEAERVTEPGLYKWDLSGPTVIYRVRKARTSHRLYAEKVTVHLDDNGDEKHVEFLYNAKAINFLRSKDKLTWAEAREFGAAFGACVACGRTLSDSRSLVQGYGATCAKRYHWPTVTAKQAEAVIEGVMTWDDVIAGLGVLTS
jgi:intracellular sulfur oxidation DsrE/DsrF family protein